MIAVLVDATALASDRELAELGVNAARIRKWASRGVLERRGRDAAGRVLYDYDEVLELATRRRVTAP